MASHNSIFSVCLFVCLFVCSYCMYFSHSSFFVLCCCSLKCNFGQEPFLFTPSDDEFQPLMQKEASPAIQMMFDKYSSEKKLIESEGLLRITDDLKFTDGSYWHSSFHSLVFVVFKIGYSPYILLQKMSPGNFHVDFVSLSAFCRKYKYHSIDIYFVINVFILFHKTALKKLVTFPDCLKHGRKMF